MSLEITSRIGVFDSGVGGLSVLRQLRRELPNAALTYAADSAHAPYGERPEAYVVDRSLALTRYLLADGAQMIVVACNTATAIAINRLRDEWPDVPFVGVEPGLKPASASSRNGRVGILATPGTLASERFLRLLTAQPPGTTIVPQPCPGLAGLIEQLDVKDPRIAEAIETFCSPLRRAGVDTVVLGCTHYAFVADTIQTAMGREVDIVDTAQAVAQQTARIAGSLKASPDRRDGEAAQLRTTGELATFVRATAGLWPHPCEHQAVAID